MDHTNHVPKKEWMAYCVGALGQGMVYAIMSSYISDFYISVLKLTPLFVLLLMLLAVVTKVIGCGLGAKIMRYTNKESLQIGIGMISRGEVALIVANKGASVGLMSEKFMTPLVIMVVFTTIVTPILLKFVFPKKKDNSGETPSGELAGLEKSGINTGLEES